MRLPRGYPLFYPKPLPNQYLSITFTLPNPSAQNNPLFLPLPFAFCPFAFCLLPFALSPFPTFHPPTMANILISDDHPLTLMGTKAYIESLGHHVCELCSNGISAYNMILQRKPDIAILDINMPGMNGMEVLEKLQSQPQKTKVILLTMNDEWSIFNRAKELNVKGYVLKEFSADVLGHCIEAVLNNETWFNPELSAHLHINKDTAHLSLLDKLTFAEKKIVTLIARAQSSKEIAQTLFISEKTVENHRSNIIKKLELPSEKNALLLWAVKNLPE